MEEIEIPQKINTANQFLVWFKSKDKEGNNKYSARMKKSKLWADRFSLHNGKVHYLKSDGVGRGLSGVKGLRKNLTFLKN